MFWNQQAISFFPSLKLAALYFIASEPLVGHSNVTLTTCRYMVRPVQMLDFLYPGNTHSSITYPLHPLDIEKMPSEDIRVSVPSNSSNFNSFSPSSVCDATYFTLLDKLFFYYKLLFNLYFTICPAGHLVNFSNLITK